MTTRKSPSIFDLAEMVAAIPAEDCADMTIYAPQIIEIFRGTGMFMQYDERWRDMNDASGGRFHLTRGIRNSHIWGPLLFEADSQRRGSR